jgi:hypothetical protein
MITSLERRRRKKLPQRQRLQIHVNMARDKGEKIPVSYRGVTLNRDGLPLEAGEIPQYSTIEFEVRTGRVISIEPEEGPMARQVKTVKHETVSVRTIDGVADNISHLRELHEERAALYGNDFLRNGAALIGMFPDGLDLRTQSDFTRYALLNQIHTKLMRYASRFHEGGHADSLDDISVYAQMLKHADEVIK